MEKVTLYHVLCLLAWLSAIFVCSTVNGAYRYDCIPGKDTFKDPVGFASKLKGSTALGDMPLTETDETLITNLAKELKFTKVNGQDRLRTGNLRFREYKNHAYPEVVNGYYVSNKRGGLNCYRLFPDVGNSNIKYYEYGNDLRHLYHDENAMKAAISGKEYDARRSKITAEDSLKKDHRNRLILRVDTNTGEITNIVSSVNHYDPPYLRVDIQSKKDLIDIKNTGIFTNIQNKVLDKIKSVDENERKEWQNKKDFYNARSWAENPKNSHYREYNRKHKKYDELYAITLKSKSSTVGPDRDHFIESMQREKNDYSRKILELENKRSRIDCKKNSKRSKRNVISFKQDQTLTSSCLRIVKRMDNLKRTFRRNKMDMTTLRSIGEDVNDKMSTWKASTKESRKMRIASKMQKIDAALSSTIGLFQDVTDIFNNGGKNNNGRVAVKVVNIMGQLTAIGGAFAPPPIGFALSIGSQIIGAIFGMEKGPSMQEVMGDLIDKQTRIITELFDKQTRIITELFDRLDGKNDAIFRNTTFAEANGAKRVLETTHGFLAQMWKDKKNLTTNDIDALNNQVDIKTGVHHIGMLKYYFDVFCKYDNVDEYFFICLSYLSLYVQLSSMRMVQLTMLADIYAEQKDLQKTAETFRATHKASVRYDLSILREHQGIETSEQRCRRHYLARHESKHSFMLSYMNYLGIPFHKENVVFVEAQNSTQVLNVYKTGDSYYLNLQVRTGARGQQWLSDGAITLSNNEFPDFELQMEKALDNGSAIMWSKLSHSQEDSAVTDNGINLESGMMWRISKYNDLTNYKNLQCRASSYIVVVSSRPSMELVSPMKICAGLGRKEKELTSDFVRLLYANAKFGPKDEVAGILFSNSLCADDKVQKGYERFWQHDCHKLADTLLPFTVMRNRTYQPHRFTKSDFAYIVINNDKQLIITGALELRDIKVGPQYSILTKTAGGGDVKIFDYPKISEGKKLKHGPCLVTFENKIFSVDPSSNTPFMYNMRSKTSEVTVLPRIMEPNWKVGRCAVGIWNDYPVMMLVERMNSPSSSLSGPRIISLYMTPIKSTRWQLMPTTLPVKSKESFIGMSDGLITLINGVDIQYFDEVSNQWKKSLHHLKSPAYAIVHVTNVGWDGDLSWKC